MLCMQVNVLPFRIVSVSLLQHISVRAHTDMRVRVFVLYGGLAWRGRGRFTQTKEKHMEAATLCRELFARILVVLVLGSNLLWLFPVDVYL